MSDRFAAPVVVAVLAALLVACVPQVVSPPTTERQRPADFPDAYYQQLSAQGKSVFRVDAARSVVVILVRRGGSLAQFGHDHVVASHDVTGYIAPEAGRADIFVPLEGLRVDEQTLRDEAGFDTRPSPADIAGTRANMLDRVLETSRYPFAQVAANEGLTGGGPRNLRLAVTLHGITRPADAEVRVDETPDEVIATGAFAIDQTQFDITPLSILGGAIVVEDRVNISFRVRAFRAK